jgi:hypothetical protein
MNYFQYAKESDEELDRTIDNVLAEYASSRGELSFEQCPQEKVNVAISKQKKDEKKRKAAKKRDWEKANSKLVKADWQFMKWNKKAEKKSKNKVA